MGVLETAKIYAPGQRSLSICDTVVLAAKFLGQNPWPASPAGGQVVVLLSILL